MPLVEDEFEIRLTLDKEGGEDAHVDIALVVHSQDKSVRGMILAEVRMRLVEAFDSRAVEWICDDEREDLEHPLKNGLIVCATLCRD